MPLGKSINILEIAHLEKPGFKGLTTSVRKSDGKITPPIQTELHGYFSAISGPNIT